MNDETEDETIDADADGLTKDVFIVDEDGNETLAPPWARPLRRVA